MSQAANAFPVVGQRIFHKVYGPGTIIGRERKGRMHRYRMPTYTTLNFTVKFDRGGPMGWADNSTHPVSELELL